jgi:endonuclease YncB( thermonuclease family)
MFVNDQDIDLLSLKVGHARYLKRYSSDKDYESAEEYAKKNRLGSWELPNPLPPLEWRKKINPFVQNSSHFSRIFA